MEDEPKLIRRAIPLLAPEFGSRASESFIDIFMTEAVERARKEFDEHLKTYVLNNLKRLGFEFKNNSELEKFTAERISKVTFEESPNYHELYVDYVDLDNMGQYIGSYDTTTQVTFEGDKLVTTIGNPL